MPGPLLSARKTKSGFSAFLGGHVGGVHGQKDKEGEEGKDEVGKPIKNKKTQYVRSGQHWWKPSYRREEHEKNKIGEKYIQPRERQEVKREYNNKMK